jgi:hypothetical protein
MKLLKQATEQYNLDNSTVVIYENVQFPLGFNHFLEALEINHLVPADYTRESCSGGVLWCDARKDGGVRIETMTHPYVNNSTPRMIIEGVEDSQRAVSRVLTQHGVKYTPYVP